MNKVYRSLVIGLLLISGSGTLSAGPEDIPSSGLIMRESSKMPMMQKKTIDIDIEIERPPLKKPMVPQSNLQVTVRSFRFSGNSQFPASALQPMLSQYTNRPLNFADLQQAAAVITEYYRKAGFMFAYVYLPEQALEHGQVELAIFEGQVNDKQFEK